MTNIVTEAGHWYYPDGTPCYEIDGRGTTLRDARRLGLYPSVTEILKIINKPMLNHWVSKQVLLSSLTLPRIEGETDDELVERILKDSRDQAERAREKGTYIHGIIEKYLMGIHITEKEKRFVEKVLNKLKNYLGYKNLTQIFNVASCEKSLTTTIDGYGFGGKVDLFSILGDWVIDFKTKEFDKVKLNSRFAYPEHKLQLGGYSYLTNCKRLINVYISTHKDHTGLVKIEEHTKDYDWARDTFIALLKFWYSYKKYSIGGVI